MSEYKLYLGNCLDHLEFMQDSSVDSIVTDPPYGLSFMGKKWDYDVPTVEIWAECLRVLKPGGHLLAFAGTRTQHRMAVNIEDAGFEIRDMVSFLYDTNEAAQDLIESLSPEQLKLLDATFGRDGMLAWTYGSGFPKSHNLNGDWGGWGTALKPAIEPITVARKPFKGTVVANVLAHGTGAMNIDGSRVGDVDGRWPANLIHDGSDDVITAFPEAKGQQGGLKGHSKDRISKGIFGNMKAARYAKARVEEDKSAARFFYCAKASRKERHEGVQDPGPQFQHGATLRKVENTDTKGNNHPTVKPTDLMAYLCRLVTPPGRIVLDPFMGSGSTGKAALREGFGFIGIEIDPDYFEIAKARIKHEANKNTR